MTFHDIVKKLNCSSRIQNLLFGISVSFAAAMIGAYGVLLFSPVVTDVLMTGGSTYVISLFMYGITIIGIFVFLLYANGIYSQFHKKESGVLLSLGLPNKAVIKMQNQQLNKVFLVSGIVGLVLSVPLAFCFWSFLTIFLTYTERTFTVGYVGVLTAASLLVFAWILLRRINTSQILKMDVIPILHSSSECEIVAGSSPVLGVIGLFSVPIGLILFNITAVIQSLKSISLLFIGVTLIGIYLTAAQITSIGRLAKRFFPSSYRKHILFYNLIRMKGNQYTLSFFVSSMLIALTIFSVCFNGCSFLEMYYQINEEPYDYALLIKKEQKALDKKAILSYAEDFGIQLSEWNTIEMLLIGREHQYKDSRKNEWSHEFAVSESTFNQLSNLNVSVQNGDYALYQDSNDSLFQTCSEENGLFYNPSTQNDFSLKKGELIMNTGILNQTASIDSFLILNDEDYRILSDQLEKEYKLKYYLFNGNNPKNSRIFQQKLLTEIVTQWGGNLIDNYQEQVIERKQNGFELKVIPYKGNELYAAKWWDFYPYAKQTELSVQLEAGAVYLLLVFFISIITFVSATMIMCLKITGTILQDSDSYKRSMYLGLEENRLKSLIRNQIGLIFFFPAVCGSLTAIIMINRFMSASSVTHINEITMVAILLSFAVVLLQIIVFFFLQKKQVITTAKLIYDNK